MKTGKLRLISALLAVAMMVLLAPTAALAATETTADGLKYEVCDDEEADYIMITGYTGREGKLVIPNEIGGIPVMVIYYRAFSQNQNLIEVEIPGSVRVIWGQAFWECKRLEKVTIGEGVWAIDEKVFEGCTGLKEVTLPTTLDHAGANAFAGCTALEKIIYDGEQEAIKEKLSRTGIPETVEIVEPETPEEPEMPQPTQYTITIDNGTAYIDGEAVTTAKENDVVTIVADETAFDGMVFERWEIREGNVTLTDDHAAETTFTMPAGAVHLEAMPATDSDDSSWDTATIVTGAVIGTGTAILAYHIGTELYAEQVLGKDAVVPRTRGEVALLAWQLAGQPEPANAVAPLTDEAKAQQWAVESGLLKLDAEGNFNAEKKLSKLKALRVLDKAQKTNAN